MSKRKKRKLKMDLIEARHNIYCAIQMKGGNIGQFTARKIERTAKEYLREWKGGKYDKL